MKNTMIKTLLHAFLIGISLLSLNTQAGIKITYIHNDALGSPVAGTDEQGNVKWRAHYQPYGEELLGERQLFGVRTGYTGHRDDPETGLTYMGARYYSPTLGRFMGVDPAGVDSSNIHSFNRYAYANNNPYKFLDPDGQATALAACAAGPGTCAIGIVVTIFAIDQGIRGTQDALRNENANDDDLDSSADDSIVEEGIDEERKSRGKGRFKSTDNASDQFEEVQREQNRRRKQGDSVSIQSIEKSRQRDRNALKPSNIDNLDEF